eukprot:Gb_14738 [translate_table: standard]
MGTPTWAFSFLLIWLFLCIRVSANRLQDLDTQVQNNAFNALYRKKTGIIYNVTVPSNYSGITAQVIRLRAGSLRRRGVTFNEFTLPKGVVVEGNPKSVLLVYKNFGENTSYFSAMHYEFVAPVVSILVYNASVSSHIIAQPELKLMARVNPISIKIPLYISGEFTPSCALLNSSGGLTKNFQLGSQPNVCHTSQLGEFSLVIRSDALVPAPSPAKRENTTGAGSKGKRSDTWKTALGAALGGIVAIVALLLVGSWATKEVDKAKIAKMEKYADNEETLQTSLIGNSRAPTAGGTRTRPVLENEDST